MTNEFNSESVFNNLKNLSSEKDKISKSDLAIPVVLKQGRDFDP